MDTEVDLTTADRDVLMALIVRQQAIIARLEKRIAQLEGRAKPANSRRMPGLKPNAKTDRKPAPPKGTRKPRPHGFARARMTPTHRVEHAMDNCPDCGTQLSGGWTHRTREVIDLPQVPAEVTEHVYMARICPGCRRQRAQPDRHAAGRGAAAYPQRPVVSGTVHQLRLSVGAIVSAIHRTAQRAQPEGPRAWTASAPARWSTPTKPAGVRAGPTATRGLSAPPPNATPCERYFLRRGRGKTVVDEALSDSFSGVLVSDFYAAYHHYDGPKQRCWAHLLRDIHDQRTLYPDAAPLARWADVVHGIYDRAKACTHPQAKRRRTAQLALERQLLALCQPFWHDPSATQAKLCRRIERHIKSLPRTGCGELFVFVAEPAVPSDNNAAERSLRHLVVSRKISGGTRSERGTDSKMTLASLFGTWRVQGLNPLTACRKLLRSLQL